MAQRPVRRVSALVVAIGLIVAACDDGGGGASTSTSTAGPTTTIGGSSAAVDGAAPRLFGLQLSEGSAQAVPPEPTPVVDGSPVDQQRIDEITARLPEWIDAGTQNQSFNWPV